MTARAYMSIGDVLSLLREEFPDVTISKIRFLESQRLINPERSPSGYRKFYEADVERLRWVLRQQRDHFLPLKVIRDRLATAGNGVPSDEPATDHGEGSRPSVATRVAASVTTARLAAEGTSNGTTVQVVEPPAAAGEPAPVAEDGPGADPTEPARPAAAADGMPPPAPAVPAAVQGNDRAADERGATAGAAMGGGTAGDTVVTRTGPVTHPLASQPGLAGERAERREVAASGEWRKADAGAQPKPPDDSTVATHASAEPPAPPQRHVPAHAAGVEAVPAHPVPARGAPDAANPVAGGPVSAQEAEPAERRTAAAGEPAGRGPSLTLDELCAASGLGASQIAALESFGLIEPTTVAGATYYDDEAVAVATMAAELGRYGIEARHLRLFRTAVDREVGLVEQVVAPLLRQRNPEARQRAVESAREMARLGEELRAALLRRELRRQFGG